MIVAQDQGHVEWRDLVISSDEHADSNVVLIYLLLGFYYSKDHGLLNCI